MSSTTGVIRISIDLELGVAPTASAADCLPRIAERLLDLLNRYGLSAAWGLADPAHSAATEALLHSAVGQEIALLGEPAWVGSEGEAPWFPRELKRRLEGSRAQGIPVRSLMLRACRLERHAELLRQSGVSALRPDPRYAPPAPSPVELASSNGNSPIGPAIYPVDLALPGRSGWVCETWNWVLLRRRAARSIQSGLAMHLAIDGARLAREGGRGLALVERAFALLAKAVHAGQWKNETLTAPHTAITARSIAA